MKWESIRPRAQSWNPWESYALTVLSSTCQTHDSIEMHSMSPQNKITSFKRVRVTKSMSEWKKTRFDSSKELTYAECTFVNCPVKSSFARSKSCFESRKKRFSPFFRIIYFPLFLFSLPLFALRDRVLPRNHFTISRNIVKRNYLTVTIRKFR